MRPYAAKGGQLFNTPAADLSVSLDLTTDGRRLEFTVTNSGPATAYVEAVFRISGGAIGSFGGTLAPGQSVTPFGSLVVAGDRAYAEVLSSTLRDPDSTPNNYANGFDGPAVEDDEAVFQVPSGS